jgi:peptidoglycan/LPS O-acetylase OafA/YrhL
MFAPRMPRIRPTYAFAMLLVVAFVPLFSATNRFLTLLLVFVLDPALYVSIAGLLLHVVQSPYRILNWAPVAWLGRISYSLYLWQQPFCSDPKLRSGYLAAFAIATACFSYYFVEQPMLRHRERSTPSSGGESATNVSSAAA